jgi:hypothetical protein
MTAPAIQGPPSQFRRPQHPVPGKGLGRQYSVDYRDRRHVLTEDRMRAVPRGTLLRRRTRPWGFRGIMNQGNTNRCTVFAAVKQKESAPKFADLKLTNEDLTKIYREALRTDEFAGEADEGTSERAVQTIFRSSESLARVLGRPIKDPWTDEFLWVDDEDMAKEYLLTRAMLLQGTDWLSGLDSPDKHGYVEPTGYLRGGHEYVLRWYYGPRHYKYPDTYEYINSWGDTWGDKGLFRMKADGFKYLVWQLNGDLMSAVEAA